MSGLAYKVHPTTLSSRIYSWIEAESSNFFQWVCNVFFESRKDAGFAALRTPTGASPYSLPHLQLRCHLRLLSAISTCCSGNFRATSPWLRLLLFQILLLHQFVAEADAESHAEEDTDAGLCDWNGSFLAFFLLPVQVEQQRGCATFSVLFVAVAAAAGGSHFMGGQLAALVTSHRRVTVSSIFKSFDYGRQAHLLVRACAYGISNFYPPLRLYLWLYQ